MKLACYIVTSIDIDCQVNGIMVKPDSVINILV